MADQLTVTTKTQSLTPPAVSSTPVHIAVGEPVDLLHLRMLSSTPASEMHMAGQSVAPGRNPLLKGIGIMLIPSLLMWVAVIEVASKFKAWFF